MLKDRFGNEIKAGVKVTYPSRRGSMLEIIDGVVVSVYQRFESLYSNVQVPAVRIRAQSSHLNTPTIRTVGAIERITVVNPDVVNPPTAADTRLLMGR